MLNTTDGTFIHTIIQKYATGELSRDDAVNYYLENFSTQVQGEIPRRGTVLLNYFEQGLKYVQNINLSGDILAVEKNVSFSIGDKNFTGFIDLVGEDERGLFVMDHKSKIIKPRSNRSKPTKTDELLDGYLRQLYLYSIPVKDIYGSYPSELRFNCFRSNSIITEPFNEDVLGDVKKWATNSVDTIINNEQWKPKVELFKCRYICDVCKQCNYYEMFRR